MKTAINFFLVGFIYLFPHVGHTQVDWKLKRNENGIKVFTRVPSNDKFKEVKVMTELPGTPKQLVSTILDVEGHSNWVYGVKNAQPIKEMNKSLIYYNEFELPFPVKDRNMVLEIRYSNDPKSQKTFIEINSIDSNILEKKNFVRVSSLSAYWEIIPTSNKSMKIIYILSVDPGGDLPSFVYNLVAANGPYESFIKLRKELLND